jgi:methyl-accepting chemotaxis protein
MSEISAASIEQTSGIEQVNQAIGQMDEVTQQNAALVEQAAANAESLEEQAQNLSGTVSGFKLDDSFGIVSSGAPVKAGHSFKPAPPSRTVIGKSAAATRPKAQMTASHDEWEEFCF